MEPAESPPIVLGLLAVIILVLANAFFVAAEFALVGARRTRLDEMAKAGDGKARLARRAVQSLDRYISATQLGITVAAVATHTTASIIAFIIITVLHIILGELVPKALALLYPEVISGWVAAPLIGFAWVMALPIAML